MDDPTILGKFSFRDYGYESIDDRNPLERF